MILQVFLKIENLYCFVNNKEYEIYLNDSFGAKSE